MRSQHRERRAPATAPRGARSRRGSRAKRRRSARERAENLNFYATEDAAYSPLSETEDDEARGRPVDRELRARQSRGGRRQGHGFESDHDRRPGRRYQDRSPHDLRLLGQEYRVRPRREGRGVRPYQGRSVGRGARHYPQGARVRVPRGVRHDPRQRDAAPHEGGARVSRPPSGRRTISCRS